MAENKVLFVTCVNNKSLYNKSLQYIKRLQLPSFVSLDFLPIYQAQSMTSGYNEALSHDAKYKVYLHQDVFILYQDFIVDIIHLFEANPKLGMIGMAGCKKLPKSGVWWKGNGLAGKVYMEKLYEFGKVQNDIEHVHAIDGFIIVKPI